MRHAIILPLLLLAACAALPLRAAEPAAIVRTDVPYVAEPADRERQSLDIYAPAGEGPFPIVVFIHGGAWSIGDKVGTGHRLRKAPAMQARGYVFISINYRMSPQVGHPVYVQDVAAAIAWVHAHAAEFRGDPARIAVMGHSAGAHLAALVAADSRWLAAHNLPLSTVRAAVLLDGPGYHLPRQIAATLPRLRTMYTDAFTADPEVWRDASPALHIQKDEGVGAFQIWHVGDRAASRLQSDLLATTLTAAGYTATTQHAPDDDHASLNRDFGLPDDPETRAIFTFLDSILRPAAAPAQ